MCAARPICCLRHVPVRLSFSISVFPFRGSHCRVCLLRIKLCAVCFRYSADQRLRTEWYDCLGVVTSGSVVVKQGRSSRDAADRQFIRNVIANLDNGEQWLAILSAFLFFLFVCLFEFVSFGFVFA